MSRPEAPPGGCDVRMNVKVSRRDFPVLAEEIVGMPKGPRRTSRLVHLATLGLFWERAIGGAEAPLPERCSRHVVESNDATDAMQPYRSRLGGSQLTALLDG